MTPDAASFFAAIRRSPDLVPFLTCVVCFGLFAFALLAESCSVEGCLTAHDTAGEPIRDPFTGEPLQRETWTPTLPPVDDLECWRSGHAVVCIPARGC